MPGNRSVFHRTNSNNTMSRDAAEEATVKCLSFVVEGNQIALAAYDEDKNEIIVEESRAHGHDAGALIESFKQRAQPNLILLGAKVASNQVLLDNLTRPLPGIVTNTDTSESSDRPASDSGSIQISQPQNNTNESNGSLIPYRLLKSSAFDIRTCRSTILSKLRVLTLIRQQQQQQQQQPSHFGMDRDTMFPLNGVRQYTTDESSYHSLASLINFDSAPLLRALGSLIIYLQGTVFKFEEGNTVTVYDIKNVSSSLFMHLDDATLNSLHIFSTEYHPLRHGGACRGKSTHSKEGFSLFSLLDRTKSNMGRSMLREWMLKPLLSIHDIQIRQAGVEIMLHSSLAGAVNKLVSLLNHVSAVDKMLFRMQKCHAQPMDYISMSRTLSAAQEIWNLLMNEFWPVAASLANDNENVRQQQNTDHEHEYCIFLKKILEKCHVPTLTQLKEKVITVIDEEMTVEANTKSGKDAGGGGVAINFGFNEDLDSAKEAFETLENTLSAIGAQILNKFPELGQLKVIFLPQVGFLISLDKNRHFKAPDGVMNENENDMFNLPSDFTFVFIQGEEAFFKNPDMRTLDDDIGDLDAYIRDKESLIVSELEDEILDAEVELRSTFSAFAELDCILSFAACAADLNFTRPLMVDDNDDIIFIENGRHPLQELILDIDNEFIPNNTHLNGTTHRLNIITGPNYSGKSCYTRQVGVLVFMAHIGSFLPCTKAKVSITHQILTKINTIETCAVPQSSFQLDLTQLAKIMRQSNRKTLVLIDEFGKGTAPASGIAVLTSALRKLSSIQCRVICTTHFLEIFSLGLFHDGEEGVKAMQMAIHIPTSNTSNTNGIGIETVVPLFRLEEGVSKSSAGLVCAKMAGVNKSVVSRAKEILDAMKVGKPVRPINANLNSNLACKGNAKVALRYFLNGVESWLDASETQLSELHQKVLMM